MTIHEDNYIEELKKHNEKALCYVIDTYGSYLNAVIFTTLGFSCCLSGGVFK